jgi:hypothetical protein
MGAQSKQTLPPWGYAVAGATGAVLANAVVYPLDMYVFPFALVLLWNRVDCGELRGGTRRARGELGNSRASTSELSATLPREFPRPQHDHDNTNSTA